jgi:hypothetical protein
MKLHILNILSDIWKSRCFRLQDNSTLLGRLHPTPAKRVYISKKSGIYQQWRGNTKPRVKFISSTVMTPFILVRVHQILEATWRVNLQDKDHRKSMESSTFHTQGVEVLILYRVKACQSKHNNVYLILYIYITWGGLHVSTLLSHLQAIKGQIHTIICATIRCGIPNVYSGTAVKQKKNKVNRNTL